MTCATTGVDLLLGHPRAWIRIGLLEPIGRNSASP